MMIKARPLSRWAPGLRVTDASRMPMRGSPHKLLGAYKCVQRRMRRDFSIVAAAFTAKGTKYEPADIRVARIMGEGSYGQVFEVKNAANRCRARNFEQAPLSSVRGVTVSTCTLEYTLHTAPSLHTTTPHSHAFHYN